MGDHEEARRGGGVGVAGGRERQPCRRPIHGETIPAEHEEIEVELAGTPAPAPATTGLALQVLECDEEVRGARRGIGSRGDIERDDRVQEVRLIGDAHGLRAVQPRDATEASAGQGGERRDGVGQRSARVADVRPEPDVRPNPPRHGHLDRPPRMPGYSRRVQHVAVRILHPASSLSAGELERALERARATNAEMLAGLFRIVGADDVRIDTGPPDGRSFGARLRSLIDEIASGAGAEAGSGVVVLGSGAVPLLGRRGAAELVAVATSGERRALANNAYSADVIAIGAAPGLAEVLAAVAGLHNDNPLPRWLAEQAGYQVDDLRRRWRLAIDLDSPLDVLLIGDDAALADAVDPAVRVAVLDRIGRLRAVAGDPRSELVVAGRTSAATLRWLERRTASRTRALVEERGLRAAEVASDAGVVAGAAEVVSTVGATEQPSASRPPRSVLGLVLDDRGPEALGAVLAELGDGAIVDSRVLLAHRLGSDESAWPWPEDRYASDLLLADRVRDPWLRALTASARDSAIPVLLGGHTLVGPGVRLLLGRRARGRPAASR